MTINEQIQKIYKNKLFLFVVELHIAILPLEKNIFLSLFAITKLIY